MPEPVASIIVVNFNGARWLEECLPALLALEGPGHEVIVVDNASTDASRDLVQQRFPEVKLVSLDVNAGPAGGYNAGARAARGRLLAFVNNDTIAEPRWLGELARALDTDQAIGLAASCIVYLHDPSTVDSAGDAWSWWGHAAKRGHGQPVERWAVPGFVFGACATACVVRREAFEELGGFDEDFFVAFEDVDLSFRAQLLGYRCVYAAEAIVRHAGSATLGRLSREAVFFSQRNVEWVYLKNTPLGLLLCSLPVHLAYVAAAGAYFAAHGRFGMFVAAKLAAIRSMPSILRKRRLIQRRRRASVLQLWHSMARGLPVGKWAEKRFDHNLPPT